MKNRGLAAPPSFTVGAAGAFAMIFGALATGCMQPGPRDPDVSSFCADKAKAECQVSAVCAIDVQGCTSYRNSLCLADAAMATASGARTYDPGSAQACIDALNGAYGNDNTKITYAQLFGFGSITDKCERVFAGHALQDQACQVDYDCSADLICSAVSPGSSSRVCAKAEPKSAGDFCADPGSLCPGTTYCVGDGGAPQCEPAAQAGQACGASLPCTDSQRCLAGTCQARVGSGDPCTADTDCNSIAPYCDPSAGNVCTIGLTFAAGSYDCRRYSGNATAIPTVADAAVGD